jgi:ribosomal protein S18 acetylase RimI-like enzyme
MEKHIEFSCPDGAVWFRMQIHDLAEVRPLASDRLPEYADIIRKSFATVARDFGWTKEIAPTFTAFVTNEKLVEKIKDGYYTFGLYVGEKIFGFVSLTDIDNGTYELNHLAVLPEWRHYGYGKKMLDFCKDKVRELGGNRITIGIVEENIVLKNWYITNGFVHTGIKKFDWQPFTAGFMEWKVTT